MRNLMLAAIAALAPALSAQDFIHYKFDANCTSEVINYATGPQALASNGTLQTSSAISPFDVGMFGGCLAGGANLAPTYYNRVITGWNPGTQPIVGSLTMAWFMKSTLSCARLCQERALSLNGPYQSAFAPSVFISAAL